MSTTARERLLVRVGGMERFVSGFHARTHFPEKTAERALIDAEQCLASGASTVLATGGDDAMIAEWEERFLAKWAAYQASGTRVMNWFITGPARFPLARNEKRMETERRRGDELDAHAKGAAEWTRRRLNAVRRRDLSKVAATIEHKERDYGFVRVVLNKTLDRVQLVFPGKPTPAIITELKSRAFRWSPREGAWQRKLTQNGVWAAESIAKSGTPQ